MGKFISKRVEIEALEFRADDLVRASIFCDCPLRYDSVGQPYLLLHSMSGDIEAHIGDYIIQENEDKSKFYPCNKVTFENKYEYIGV